MSVHTQVSPGRFSDRVVLVTGAASGIGATTATRFAHEGARTVLADLDEAAVKELGEQLTAQGADVLAIAADQTDETQVAALFDQVRAQYGRLDVCHANAGWCRVGPFVTMPPHIWKRHFDVNVTGTFHVLQGAARLMSDHRNGGSIIITSSSGAVQPAAMFSAYSSAKAALNMLTSVLAYELGSFGIRVNAVMPGVTETAMTKDLLDTGARDLFEREVPLGRLGSPDDIADVVTFLASEASSYMTGQHLLVDGGGGIGASWFVTDFSQRGEIDWQLRHETVGGQS